MQDCASGNFHGSNNTYPKYITQRDMKTSYLPRLLILSRQSKSTFKGRWGKVGGHLSIFRYSCKMGIQAFGLSCQTLARPLGISLCLRDRPPATTLAIQKCRLHHPFLMRLKILLWMLNLTLAWYSCYLCNSIEVVRARIIGHLDDSFAPIWAKSENQQISPLRIDGERGCATLKDGLSSRLWLRMNLQSICFQLHTQWNTCLWLVGDGFCWPEAGRETVRVWSGGRDLGVGGGGPMRTVVFARDMQAENIQASLNRPGSLFAMEGWDIAFCKPSIAAMPRSATYPEVLVSP